MDVLATKHAHLADHSDLELDGATRWAARWQLAAAAITYASALVDLSARGEVDALRRASLGWARRYLPFYGGPYHWQVIGDASDGRSALDWLARAKAQGALPDVVLMEPVGGLGATAAIKRLYPEAKVVGITSFLDEDKVHAALEAAAAGCLLKDAEADEVAAAVRAAQRGEVHLDPAVARQLTASLRRGPSACWPRPTRPRCCASAHGWHANCTTRSRRRCSR